MEDQLTDDQSHYEISLTAGQAFLAFVLLLLSLSASFAFGLMIGKGQGDDRLVVRREPSIIHEGSLVPRKSSGKIVELGVADDDFKPTENSTGTSAPAREAVDVPVITETPEAAPAASESPSQVPTGVSATSAVPTAGSREARSVIVEGKPSAVAAPAATAGPAYAQLLSTGDQKAAEALAARLIDRGYTAAYVERGTTDKGIVYKVRVRFVSEVEARASEAKLREFSKEVWITR